MAEKILCVDDEPDVLTAYQRVFRKQFTLDVAAGGPAGLAALAERGPYAVVVSDMQMPGMDGVRFLSEVRTMAPLTTRIMLTGHSTVTTATDAVNEGHIFRFLTKPCTPETLGKALEAGIEQYRLVNAERELLEKTVKGSVKVLTDVLSIVNPVAFGRASRVHDLATRLADALKAKTERWEIEVAAMLSQVGCVTLPEQTLAKVFHGKPVAASELKLFQEHPAVGSDLIANIPRLEAVARMIQYQDKHYDGSGRPADTVGGEGIPLGARILKVALDFDVLRSRGVPPAKVLEQLPERAGWYDPAILDALATILREEAKFVLKTVPLQDLAPGMLLVKDVYSRWGPLLIARGQEVTRSLRIRLSNLYEIGAFPAQLEVIVPLERPWGEPPASNSVRESPV